MQYTNNIIYEISKQICKIKMIFWCDIRVFILPVVDEKGKNTALHSIDIFFNAA